MGKILDERLAVLEACTQARNWAKGKSQKEAWETCPYGSWLEWIAEWCGYKFSIRARAALRRRGTDLNPADRVRAEISLWEIQRKFRKLF